MYEFANVHGARAIGVIGAIAGVSQLSAGDVIGS